MTNWDRCYYKAGQLLWGNNYKIMQYRRQIRETVEGNRFWQLTPLFNQHFSPKNS